MNAGAMLPATVMGELWRRQGTHRELGTEPQSLPNPPPQTPSPCSLPGGLLWKRTAASLPQWHREQGESQEPPGTECHRWDFTDGAPSTRCHPAVQLPARQAWGSWWSQLLSTPPGHHSLGPGLPGVWARQPGRRAARGRRFLPARRCGWRAVEQFGNPRSAAARVASC